MIKRIQIKRVKGWKLPENTVYVGRPSKWGNPYKVSIYGKEIAIKKYQVHLLSMISGGYLDLEELRGKDLACWCKLDELCHADILLKELGEWKVIMEE